MKNPLIIAITLLLLFSTYRPQEFSTIKIFNIKEVKIENNFILKDSDIKKNLIPLYDTNLLFLNISNIEKILTKNNFIESLEVKKIYPNKLKIKIFEKSPIAVLQNKKEKFYVSENFDLISYFDNKTFKNLPIIFGDKDNFRNLYINLKKINFPVEFITKYYLYELKRWDLEIFDNKIIKLPSKNYIKSLKNFMDLSKTNNFSNYKVFDYRIKNQLILK
jgi:cell division protein FtsQ|tara:strand:- start:811 stop:1467 length:657 start_codon:yes stop_codon:yes gene_type:complete